MITKENIVEEAKLGNLEVLNHPLSTVISPDTGATPLHHLSVKKPQEIFKHPLVDKTLDICKATPLHWLAHYNHIEVASHPSVTKVKDISGNTPLHCLGMVGQELILKIPESYDIENKYKQFPIELLIGLKHIKIRNIKNTAWSRYLLKRYNRNQVVTIEMIKEIKGLPNSLKFILGGLFITPYGMT